MIMERRGEGPGKTKFKKGEKKTKRGTTRGEREAGGWPKGETAKSETKRTARGGR